LTAEAYTGGPVVMLACGIGITPLMALLGELPYRSGEATLIYRARSQNDVAFRGELDWFVRHRGVRVVYLLGPRADRPSWLPGAVASRSDVDALQWVAPDIARSHVYVCGPEAWAETVRTAVRSTGLAADNLHTELFAW
jgi:ferredoxin-NADP reductase